MHSRIYQLLLVLMISLIGCSQDNDEQLTSTDTAKEIETTTTKASSNISYARIQEQIIYGRANLQEIRKALTDSDPASLSNTLHAMYAMRWHRGALHVLDGVWKLDKEKYPELAWEQLSKAPARIALASTINRIKIVDTDEYLDYIRAHKNDEHEFHRAQASIALGFNGAVEDIDYLLEMANSDNDYVIQTSITALGLMGGNQARDALVELWKHNRDNPKGVLVEELLLKSYNVIPSTTKPDTEKAGKPVG